MKRILFVSLLFCSLGMYAQSKNSAALKIVLKQARFHSGDDILWSQPAFEDKDWQFINPAENWDKQGFKDLDGFGWYRFHFTLPSSLKSASWWPDSLRFWLAKIDDADEVFLNGRLVSKTGSLPADPGGYSTRWDTEREFKLAENSPLLNWDKENVLAIRVYDGGGIGGIFGGTPYISSVQLRDLVKLDYENQQLTLRHPFPQGIKGKLELTVVDPGAGTTVIQKIKTISAGSDGVYTEPLVTDISKRLEIRVVFTEAKSGQKVSLLRIPPYILTPKPGLLPRINSAKVSGVRPGSPFLYKIAATGEKPMLFAAENLPAGLTLDAITGIISGSIAQTGNYTVTLSASNSRGTALLPLTIKCGSLLALTPPMGWNSWNCWGLSVSEEKLMASAQALLDKGLADHGWTYMNIDDGWEAEKRAVDGHILTNSKFPDMKRLGDWLHSKGLKFGIYSSPGPRTCGGYLGSWEHEQQDADMYNSWGIDYLKYDWCSYGSIHGGKDTSTASYIKPYTTMQHALRSQPRDIVYSLCQYGMKDVWKWGAGVDGNCWRTTGDIEDTWKSMYTIAFNQVAMQPYAQPGRWNDPDMLIVGNVGWGENLHPTRLNPDEQYTHISLWSLLASPLLIGCDIASMDEFTLNLLTNDEVIAVNQDPLGKQAIRKIKTEQYQVWVKELEDGSKAIGVFNVSDSYQTVAVSWEKLGLPGNYRMRDLWRQQDLGLGNGYRGKIPPHGVMLLKIQP